MSAIKIAARLVGFATNVLSAERVLAVVDGVGTTSGIATENFWMTANISQSFLKDRINTAQPIVMKDIGKSDTDALSLVLSSARTILFVPCLDQANQLRGFLYADESDPKRSFNRKHLLFARKFVHDKIEPLVGQLPPQEALSWESVQQIEWAG